MNIQETLDAAEVMRRSALGEPAKCRLRGRENWSNFTYPADMMDWDWNRYEYAIAEPPPHSENAHNPDNLTPLQVETHLGWRLLDRDEIRQPADYSECVYMWFPARPEDGLLAKWSEGTWLGHTGCATYRTRLTREELAEARGIRQPVPWSRPEHVPGPVCWLKTPKGNASLILHVAVEGVGAAGKFCGELGVSKFTWDQLASEGAHHSTDRVTWKPCTVTP